MCSLAGNRNSRRSSRQARPSTIVQRRPSSVNNQVDTRSASTWGRLEIRVNFCHYGPSTGIGSGLGWSAGADRRYLRCTARSGGGGLSCRDSAAQGIRGRKSSHPGLPRWAAGFDPACLYGSAFPCFPPAWRAIGLKVRLKYTLTGRQSSGRNNVILESILLLIDTCLQRL